jgi:hypothetical protein
MTDEAPMQTPEPAMTAEQYQRDAIDAAQSDALWGDEEAL